MQRLSTHESFLQLFEQSRHHRRSLILEFQKKLLVDILSEEKLYQSAQSERSRIIFEANSKYTINMNKLLRYASRRRKKEFIEQKIKEVLVKDYIEK